MRIWGLIVVVALGTVLTKTLGPLLAGGGSHLRRSAESSLWSPRL